MEFDLQPLCFPSDNKRPFVIAGPCSAETEEQVMTTAHQLAEKGFLTTYEKNVGEARVRKYYHLTQKGTDYLAERERDWHIFSTAVQGVLGGDGCVLA